MNRMESKDNKKFVLKPNSAENLKLQTLTLILRNQTYIYLFCEEIVCSTNPMRDLQAIIPNE